MVTYMLILKKQTIYDKVREEEEEDAKEMNFLERSNKYNSAEMRVKSSH